MPQCEPGTRGDPAITPIGDGDRQTGVNASAFTIHDHDVFGRVNIETAGTVAPACRENRVIV
jgi:hypothetical protein